MPTKSNFGSIRQRENGTWEGRYYAPSPVNPLKSVRRSVYGQTKREVKAKLLAIEDDISKGTYIEPCKMTLLEWITIWLETYTATVKPFTRKAYEDRLRLHVAPALGSVRLCDLTQIMVQRFINDLSTGRDGKPPLSAKTIKNVHGVLHRALRQAKILGYIGSNPADYCVLPKVIKPEIKPLTDDQAAAFLRAIQGDPYELVFALDLFTGLRQGEILGLTWDCIDWKARFITVRKQLQCERKKGGRYYLTTLKNDKVRRIGVSDYVLALLERRRAEQQLEKETVCELWHEDIPNLIFENPFGGHLSHTTVRNHFKRIVKELGLPEARFHDMRHTYAVMSLQNGDDVKTVQDNLGHHSAAFTLDQYGHSTDKMKGLSAERMEAHIRKLTEE